MVVGWGCRGLAVLCCFLGENGGGLRIHCEQGVFGVWNILVWMPCGVVVAGWPNFMLASKIPVLLEREEDRGRQRS